MTESLLHTLRVPDAFGGADHCVQVHDAGSEQFAARLRKMARERRKWARKGNIACYRIYDGDLPDFACAIDAYVRLDGQPAHAQLSALDMEYLSANTFLHIAEYQAPGSIDPAKAQARFADVLALAPVCAGVPEDHVFAKVRRKEKGGSQYAENRKPFVFRTQEDGLWFEVDMNGYLDTGLFLDHRVTRQLVGRLSVGKRVLNLFSYTGSATVHAAAGGAAATVTVDLSQTYLDWARRNMAYNGFVGANHAFQRGDTMAWLARAAEAGLQFDLMFVDPPTFSNSKAMGKVTWDVQRDHAELLRRCRAVLAPGGMVVFSCNLRSFKLDGEALSSCGYTWKDITPSTIPHDFERNPKIHCCFALQ
ncbi:MAG: class I SAM-dependent methyltransferase [Coriobacteriia bacterium]|nr:class I SAM-dependent methyltransferase [Coriobacteriia bacterium]